MFWRNENEGSKTERKLHLNPECSSAKIPIVNFNKSSSFYVGFPTQKSEMEIS